MSTETERFDEDGPAFGTIGAPPAVVEDCRHDTIAEFADLRVCLDCGTPDPKRGEAS
ncbi:MAG TPA: hypothetical protein VFY84_19810 [Jiangellales bacterium]|nr:hypothetical protein [Jiangellales bacterium]